MILDERTEFADATSVAAVASTFVVGDVVDLGGTTQDIGLGEPVWCVVQTDTDIVAAGAGTIAIQLVSDALTTLGGAVVANCTLHFTTGSLVTAASAAGSQLAGGVLAAFLLPAGTYERYLGILCTIATQTVNTGKINAFLTRDYAKWIATADATN